MTKDVQNLFQNLIAAKNLSVSRQKGALTGIFKKIFPLKPQKEFKTQG
jgi:hypothetical protein